MTKYERVKNIKNNMYNQLKDSYYEKGLLMSTYQKNILLALSDKDKKLIKSASKTASDKYKNRELKRLLSIKAISKDKKEVYIETVVAGLENTCCYVVKDTVNYFIYNEENDFTPNIAVLIKRAEEGQRSFNHIFNIN
jgi:hypothetical protein